MFVLFKCLLESLMMNQEVCRSELRCLKEINWFLWNHNQMINESVRSSRPTCLQVPVSFMIQLNDLGFDNERNTF